MIEVMASGELLTSEGLRRTRRLRSKGDAIVKLSVFHHDMRRGSRLLRAVWPGTSRRSAALWRERHACEKRGNARQDHARKIRRAGRRLLPSDNDDAEPMRGSAHILMMQDRERTKQL